MKSIEEIREFFSSVPFIPTTESRGEFEVWRSEQIEKLKGMDKDGERVDILDLSISYYIIILFTVFIIVKYGNSKSLISFANPLVKDVLEFLEICDKNIIPILFNVLEASPDTISDFIYKHGTRVKENPENSIFKIQPLPFNPFVGISFIPPPPLPLQSLGQVWKVNATRGEFNLWKGTDILLIQNQNTSLETINLHSLKTPKNLISIYRLFINNYYSIYLDQEIVPVLIIKEFLFECDNGIPLRFIDDPEGSEA